MRSAELVAFAIWCFALSVAGGAMGLVLGNLRAPASVEISTSPAAGLGANIVISGAAATVGSIGHIRAGRVNWRLVAWMLPPSLAGGAIGAVVSASVPERVLLFSIAAVLFWNARALLLGRNAKLPATPAHQPSRALAVATAFGVGVLGGFVGLILGSLRVPAMIRHLREPPHLVVGSNMVLGASVALAALSAHLLNPGGTVDGETVAVGILASAPGAVIGARFTGRLSEAQLVKAIGVTVALAGSGLVARALLG